MQYTMHNQLFRPPTTTGIRSPLLQSSLHRSSSNKRTACHASNNPRTQTLRGLLDRPGILKGPCCHDALSAKLIEQAGFDYAFMSGFCTSAARLGAPDTGLISYAEMVDQGRYIHEATRALPIIGDGDTGYGNALNVKRTVKGYAQAGFAGILIEDQVMPKSCGHVRGKKVTSREEAVSRIKAAVDAREEGADILILARTDARQAVSLEEALWRASAFAEAGADMLFIDALASEEEMKALCSLSGAAARVPKMANMLEGGGKTPIMAPEQLQALGFKLVAYPLSLLGVSIRSMQQALQSLQGGKIPSEEAMGSFQDIQKAVGFEEYFEQEARYALPSTPSADESSSNPTASTTSTAAGAKGGGAQPSSTEGAPTSGEGKDGAREGGKASSSAGAAGAGSSSERSSGSSGASSAGQDKAEAQEVKAEVADAKDRKPGEVDKQPASSWGKAAQQPREGEAVEADAVIEEPRSMVNSSRTSLSERAPPDTDSDGSRRNLLGRTLLVRVTKTPSGQVQLETRIPAGFLSGLTALVPRVSGLNIESMIERALRDRSLESKAPLVSLDVSSSERLEVFLE